MSSSQPLKSTSSQPHHSILVCFIPTLQLLIDTENSKCAAPPHWIVQFTILGMNKHHTLIKAPFQWIFLWKTSLFHFTFWQICARGRLLVWRAHYSGLADKLTLAHVHLSFMSFYSIQFCEKLSKKKIAILLCHLLKCHNKARNWKPV